MRWSLALCAVALAAGQSKFEVATVKPSSPEQRSIGMLVYPGGRMVITNYTLRDLVHEAWNVEPFLIEGGPKWAAEERYSITATPPPGSQSSKVNPRNIKLPPIDEERRMLQALVTDRFGLVVREEERDAPVLALTLSGQRHKMQPPKDPETFPVVVYGRSDHPDRPNFLRGENAPAPMIARRFSDMLKRPVLDRTGLEGSFDFYFEYVQGLSETADGPSLTTAVQSIGLKLVPARAPVRYVVIEKAERPSAN